MPHLTYTNTRSSADSARTQLDKVTQPLKDFVDQTKQDAPEPADESTRGSEKTIPDREQVGDDTIATELNGEQPIIRH